ncbi:hypothetical protein F4824DRAFT_50947 [Ustulina deusta]|nr:hypothetical protein F4824DRAFT_50947 [Ustulina deusta]
MGLNTGARLMRLQPALVRHIHHRTASVPPSLPFRLSQLPAAGNPRANPLGSCHRNNAQLRAASTSATSEPRTADDASPASPPTTTPSEPPPPPPAPSPGPFSDALNPPASTRPPPLDLPVRDPSTNLFTHLFRLGKAYTKFYGTGLKAVFTNRRLLRALPATPPPRFPLDKDAQPTRSSLLLRARVRHDTLRLPLFAVMVFVCGELTPLIVLLFPRLTPYTCRIPSQTAVIRRAAQERAAARLRSLHKVLPGQSPPPPLRPAELARVADGHVCRALGIGSRLWDRVGLDVPFAKARAAAAVARLVRDDAMIRNGGGVDALVDDEVVLACDERGLGWVVPLENMRFIRALLGYWLAKSAPSQSDDIEAMLKESTDKITSLLVDPREMVDADSIAVYRHLVPVEPVP